MGGLSTTSAALIYQELCREGEGISVRETEDLEERKSEERRATPEIRQWRRMERVLM